MRIKQQSSLGALSRIAVVLHGGKQADAQGSSCLPVSLPVSVQVAAGLAWPGFSTEEFALGL